MEQAILVEHYVHPTYSAYVVDTPAGLKRLFLQGNTVVSSKEVPRQVKTELKAGLAADMKANMVLQGGQVRRVKAAAFQSAMPRSVYDVVQLLPEPDTQILQDAARVGIERPRTLGSTRLRRSDVGYKSLNTPDCHELIQQRGGKLVSPTPKYNECGISGAEFLKFVDFVSRHQQYDVHRYVEDTQAGYAPRNPRTEAKLASQFEGATVCQKLLNVLPLPPQLKNKIHTQRWSIVRHLGQGEHGSTFLAVNQKGKQAAVKVMIDTGNEALNPLKEFDMHRAFAALGLAPKAYYATSLQYRGAKIHIFVMERVEFTLYDLVCFQSLSPSMLESIGYSLAKFLWTMYQHGVTHGDMHTQNVMFKYNSKSKRYEPKLIDFSLSTTKFNDPDIDALQLISDLSQVTRMSPVVVNYLVRVLSKVVSKIRGYEVKISKRRSEWMNYFDDYFARRGYN